MIRDVRARERLVGAQERLALADHRSQALLRDRPGADGIVFYPAHHLRPAYISFSSRSLSHCLIMLW